MKRIILNGMGLVASAALGFFIGIYVSEKKAQVELNAAIQEKNNTIDQINDSNRKLIDQNALLIDSKDETMRINLDLISQNQHLISSNEKSRVDIGKRDKQIKELELTLKSYKDYVHYARYNILGEYVQDNGQASDTSELSLLMKQLVSDQGHKYRVIEDLGNIAIVNRVIAEYPDFPFGYYVKYFLLGISRDPEWIKYARKAIEIFEITTAVDGHDPTHESCLNEIRGNLSLINE